MQTWTAAAPLTWTRFDDSDDWVVYNPVAAHVHLLTDAARQLFTLACVDKPHSPETLAAELATAFGRSPDDELLAVTRNTLTFMERVGLLRPVTP